jgi:CRP/FNR family cyclic AMP-dependent transcriptional regulator
MSQDLSQRLASVELFSRLDPEERAQLAVLGRLEHWPRGAVVLEEGEVGPRMMVLLAGEVEVSREQGVVLATLGPGECIGETSLLLDVPRSATVRARTDLTGFSMDRAAFDERLEAGDPAALKVALALARSLARRLTRLNQVVTALLRQNAELEQQFVQARMELFDAWTGVSPDA